MIAVGIAGAAALTLASQGAASADPIPVTINYSVPTIDPSIDPSTLLDTSGFIGSGGVGFIGGDPYEQWCQPEFVQQPVGLGGPPGATIEVQAVGEVTGTDVLATRITCDIQQDGITVLHLDSGYQRDNVAEALGSFVESKADPLTKCVQVSYFNGAITPTAKPACTPVN